MLHRPARRIPGADRWWVGANYWSAAGGPFMWRTYDAATVERELATLARAGLDTVRSFCFWPRSQRAPLRTTSA